MTFSLKFMPAILR